MTGPGRSDILIPRELLDRLTVPSNSIVDGRPAWVFTRVECLRDTPGTTPVRLLLPMGDREAWRFRAAWRYERFHRWVLLPFVLVATVLTVPFVLYARITGGDWDVALGPIGDVVRACAQVFFGVALLQLIGRHGLTARQHPRVGRDGTVRISGMPGELAAEWAALNPGITVTSS